MLVDKFGVERQSLIQMLIEPDLPQRSRDSRGHGTRFAAVNGGKEIKICDIGSQKITAGARCGPYPLQATIVSPDNSRLAVEWGGANGVEPGLGLYEMGTGKEIARIKLAEWGHIIGFSPDGKTLLVGGPEFVIYDSANGKKIRSLKLLDDVSFSHDWNH